MKEAITAKVEGVELVLCASDPQPGDAEPVCTCCGGTGITYQTERRCACRGTDLSDPVAIHANMLLDIKGETK